MLAHRLRRVRQVPKTLAYVAGATSSGSTITIPATAQAGDLAALYDLARGLFTPPTPATPSNWTTISGLTASTSAGVLSYKILVAGDPGATVTGMNGSISDAKSLAVFPATPSLATVTVLESAEQSTSGNPAAQAKTAQSDYPYLVYGVCGGASALPSWIAGYAPGATEYIGWQRYGWTFFNDSAARLSLDCNDSGTGTLLQTCILMVT